MSMRQTSPNELAGNKYKPLFEMVDDKQEYDGEVLMKLIGKRVKAEIDRKKESTGYNSEVY